MLTPEEKKAAAVATRVMQIIVLALAAGVSTFLVVSIALRDPQGGSELGMYVVLFAVGAVAAALVIPVLAMAQARRAVAERKPAANNPYGANEAGQLLAAHQTQKIIRAALLEGPAFFATFVYMQGGPEYTLYITIGLILAILALFPFRRSIEEWLERELRTVRELQALRR
ncbi:MAG TPA: hypothetical protein VF175_07695 [Lacipirellula sp.]